jgi:hypothetical protein
VKEEFGMSVKTRRVLYVLPHAIVAFLVLILLLCVSVFDQEMKLSQQLFVMLIAACGFIIAGSGFAKIREWIKEGEL